MKRVVIDTNVLLVCISSQSVIHALFTALGRGDIELCVTNEIISEYLEILSVHRGRENANDILDLILNAPCIVRTVVYYRWNLISVDPDDNKFVDCAIAAEADYIITEDKHFNILRSIEFPKVDIISSSNFIDKYLT